RKSGFIYLRFTIHDLLTSGVLISYPYTAIKTILDFKNFKAQITVKRALSLQKILNNPLRALVALPAYEGREPAVDEENLACAFQFRQFCERRLKVRQCQ